MSWQPEIDELHRRRALAEACGGAEAVAKHHAQGKLTVRERVSALADPGSFREVGKLAGYMVAEVLGGKKPGDIDSVIAYETLPNFVVVVNKKSAAAMGVTLTDAVLKKATKVVE